MGPGFIVIKPWNFLGSLLMLTFLTISRTLKRCHNSGGIVLLPLFTRETVFKIVVVISDIKLMSHDLIHGRECPIFNCQYRFQALRRSVIMNVCFFFRILIET